jgi:hypothetical protein
MKVKKGEKSMKTTILWKSALVVSALLVFLFTILGEAAPMGEAGPQVATQPSLVTSQPSLKVTTRPLSEFLDAQGTTDKFFPPVRDYVGWTDNVDTDKFTIFALVDYAGLANDYLHGKLHTHVNGFVIQSDLADGRARIAVALFTTNALGFAQSGAVLRNSNFDFLNTPTIFGNKAQDVAEGAKAAVGRSIFLITFSISSPEAPLPDLVDVTDTINHPEFSPVNINFTATVPEKCKHGTRAVLHVDQKGPPDVPVREIVEIVHEPCN